MKASLIRVPVYGVMEKNKFYLDILQKAYTIIVRTKTCHEVAEEEYKYSIPLSLT
jgi:hypothetical protein